MTRKLIIIVFIFISVSIFGQNKYSKIDKSSTTVPDSLIEYQEIAEYLTKDLTSEIEKSRALYIWITHNIKYDLNQANTNKRYDKSKDLIDEVLNTRMGLCHHYSELFLSMCKSIELDSYLIMGYTRNANGEISDVNHTWNAIKIDSTYYFIDVTWAAGYLINEKYYHHFTDNYFLISPKEFIKTHMPFDPLWQLVDNPISNEQFISRDFSSLNVKGNFEYTDSVYQLETLNRLDRLKKSNKRTIACGIKHPLIQTQISENEYQIANEEYNIAVDSLNLGVRYFNLYITSKNHQFHNPKLEDQEIKKLISKASTSISYADKSFNNIVTHNDKLSELVLDAKGMTPNLLSDLKIEEEFIAKYISRWKPLRGFMFLTYE